MAYEVIDPNSWARKEQYFFFKSFEDPYTGLITEVNVTQAVKLCKSRDISFFLFYLHCSIKAVNQCTAFRLRIEHDELRLYETIHASATIMRANKTFGFSWIVYDEEFSRFKENANAEIDRIQKDPKLFPPINGEDCIHYSAVPWIKFTALDHARNNQQKDSVPKISFGKYEEDFKGQLMMPVSIHVHHALVDGLDIAEFLGKFQKYLDGE